MSLLLPCGAADADAPPSCIATARGGLQPRSSGPLRFSKDNKIYEDQFCELMHTFETTSESEYTDE